LRGLAENLIIHERIITTEARAKELRPFVEKLISKGMAGTLAARREIIARLGPRAVKKAEALSKRFKARAGGYTRITKLAKRSGDGRSSALIEFVEAK
jgi:large subunit ribosomal protein L17